MDQIYQIAVIAVPSILSYIGAHVVQFKKYTTKLDQFRDAVDDIDDAVTNPTVTEAQFQKDWADFKALIS